MGGAAVRVFLSDCVSEFAVAEHTLHQVQAFIPQLARQLDVEPDRLRLVLALLPLRLYPREFYENQRAQAERQIGWRDPQDVDVLALTLKLQCPLWSNDDDFDEGEVTHYTTAQLLRRLGL